MEEYYTIKDYAGSVLSATRSAGSTEITVTDGTNFPTTFPFVVTLFNTISPILDASMEKVACTNVVGNVLTVDALVYDHTIGTKVQLLVVEDIFNDATYGIYSHINNALIPVETLTTEGDVLVMGASALERLPIGTVGQVMVPTGLGGLIYISPHVSTGFIETPAITNKGDGSIDIPTKMVSMADNAIFEGTFLEYTLPAQTGVSLTNNSINYIVGDYNGGSPIYKVITDVDLINQSDVIPYMTLYRIDNEITKLSWGEMGDGLSNKIVLRTIKTERFVRESGLILAEDTGRIITISSGKTWNGINRLSIQAARSDTHQIYLWYHVAGVWIRAVVTQYNNTQYDDGTDLVTANPQKYIVNWIYRVEEEPPSLAIVLGGAEYTSAEAAKNEPMPSSIPDKLVQMGVLVGRIIVKQAASSSSVIESAFVQQFTPSAISDHTDLANIGINTHAQIDSYIAAHGSLTPQILIGSGAVDVVAATTHLVTSGVGDILTLADGIEGQTKNVLTKTITTPGDTSILTPINFTNGTIITFEEVGDIVTLLFTNSAWHYTGGIDGLVS